MATTKPRIDRPPLRVFLTVDTEVWPRAAGWPHLPLAPGETCERELTAYFWGGEVHDPKGLPYQLETLRRYGLQATYFVDPLFSCCLGARFLSEVAGTILAAGQEIGLHLHPEWLTDPRCEGLPKFAGPLLHQYDEVSQRKLISTGLRLLSEAGASDICAFRAGSWGANLATLRALAGVGIRYDSSMNAYASASFPDLPEHGGWIQPRSIEGIWEFPVTFFIDRPPRGKRPLHITACTFSELQLALEHAYTRGWFAVVIVFHSFEFVRVAALDRAGTRVGIQRVLVRRFERLCRYLSLNREWFATSCFRDLNVIETPLADEHPARSNLMRTLARQTSQLLSRVL